MRRYRSLATFGMAALLSACVTINVYFPAAAAQEAADRLIDEVLEGETPTAPPDAPSARAPAAEAALALLDFVIPAARAQQPDIDVSSPEIRRLTRSMEARFSALKPYLDSGVVGLTASGDVKIRDAAAVPLSERNKLRTLVENENADRAALYREIAAANGQPQWEDDIRRVFAERWIAKAPAGWYYEVDGAWRRKG